MPPRNVRTEIDFASGGFDRLEAAIARRKAASVALVQAAGAQAEGLMRATARWRDRTGLARATLHATPEVVRRGAGVGEDAEVTLRLAHGVSYGRWLETVRGPLMGRRRSASLRQLASRRAAGPLAVLWPTVDRLAPQVVRALRRLWSGRTL